MLSLAPPRVEPGSFDSSRHYYPRVQNAHLHPLLRYFFALNNERIAERYSYLHPESSPAAVHAVLDYEAKFFRWAGADLFHTATPGGVRRNIVVEVNSSPSGQKSMPLRFEEDELGGYRTLIEGAFLPYLKRRSLPKGRLAVCFDKNEMEASAYAATIAELSGEEVYLVKIEHGTHQEQCRVNDGVVEIADGQTWMPIRAMVRYITQRPWTVLPPITRTFVFNPVLICLAGGRNKLVAAKAYDLFNAQHAEDGLKIQVPETIWDVGKAEIPLWFERMGGALVVKNPYSNAGQGVYTITNETELKSFMTGEHAYEKFIVQALVGHPSWTSRTSDGQFFHVGTVPNAKGSIYVYDLRFMVGNGPKGFFPTTLNARRAKKKLESKLADHSWDVLGTNLSFKDDTGQWTTDQSRLLLMDSRDFNQLGIGIDDLTEAYLQTAMAVKAIDQMAQRCLTKKGAFRPKFFGTINPDNALSREIIQ